MNIKPHWWIATPALLDEIREVLTGPYAALALHTTEGSVCVAGNFPIIDDDEVLDTYEIEVSFPATYPDDPPSVRETAGRIPHTADRHNSTGTACLFVPIEWKLRRPDTRFETFLLGPAHSYFLSQSLVEAGEPWPFGERTHGLNGALDALNEMLSLSSIEQARAAIVVLSKGTIKGHWECPCGSGKRIRDCHGRALWDLSTANNVRWARDMVAAQIIASCSATQLKQLEKKLKTRQTRRRIRQGSWPALGAAQISSENNPLPSRIMGAV